MADVLRFKDILEMDGKGSLEDPRPAYSFNDMHVTQYRPGEDELTNYRAYRRKRISDTQHYGLTGNELGESTDVDEALTVQQRMARKRMFKRIQPKIKLGKQRAARRIASKEKLQKRAIKKARMAMFKRFTKDVPKSELTYARRQEIEKRLDSPTIKKRIAMIARKNFPKERQAEIKKKTGSKSK